MTLVVLDTNSYLRLAKRIKPLLGVKFGQKGYVLTILKDVEDEVYKSNRLVFRFPWFNAEDLQAERLAKRVRLSRTEKNEIHAVKSVLREHVLSHADDFTSFGRSPPSPTDCFILAFGQTRPSIVVTDDLGMHLLAEEFGLDIWHGYQLLKKMLSAKVIDNELVRNIYEALELNNDLPKSWAVAKHKEFKKLF